ncbi:HNH endonuclease signature motif containing protein [Acinetobacter sp.]|uniref:HNH endonuclease n=1 Tax=Acinetobacter sp. TaxID=472 RepID=UPI0025C42839|nr:HNH endonuclease signature motif containing protein [Acinetobacter sp.]
MPTKIRKLNCFNMPYLPKNKFKKQFKPMENRGNITKIEFPEYHTTTWRKIREQQLLISPLCEYCKEKGIFVPATVCDHIKPVKQCKRDGMDFWQASTPDNLQSLCESCHNRKSAKEK